MNNQKENSLSISPSSPLVIKQNSTFLTSTKEKEKQENIQNSPINNNNINILPNNLSNNHSSKEIEIEKPKNKLNEIKKIIPITKKLSRESSEKFKHFQKRMLNSLSQNQKSHKIIKIRNIKNIKIDDFTEYGTKINESFKEYQVWSDGKNSNNSKWDEWLSQNGCTDPFKNSNHRKANKRLSLSMIPNNEYLSYDDKTQIENLYANNYAKKIKNLKSGINNKENNIRVIIPDKNFPTPFHSLGIVKRNLHIYDQLSKDFLERQMNLYDQFIVNNEKIADIYNIKMPKVQIISTLQKNNPDIPVVNLANEKNQNLIEQNLPPLSSMNGHIKLFSYFRYPNRNFPEGREQFSITMRKNEVIITGGISTHSGSLDIWILDLESLEWRKESTNGATENRYGHTGLFFLNKLLMYGGKTKYTQNLSTVRGLEIYNFESGHFTPIVPVGLEPIRRRNHISLIIGNQMFIHGGINENNQILNDCHLLSLNPLKWNWVNISRFTPGPYLYGHAAALVVPLILQKNRKFTAYNFPVISNAISIGRSKMNEPFGSGRDKSEEIIKEKGLYVFGGKTRGEKITNQLWILILGKKTLEWVEPETKGIRPSPRFFHSMNYYEKGNFLIIHGGRNDEESELSALNDTFIFDLEHFEWLKIILYSEFNNFKILSRCAHQGVIYGNKLIILGGMNNNNYLGSTLFIINLDFFYNTKIKTPEQILLNQLEERNKQGEHKFQTEEDLIKIELLKKRLQKNQLGIVKDISLPPIK